MSTASQNASGVGSVQYFSHRMKSMSTMNTNDESPANLHYTPPFDEYRYYESLFEEAVFESCIADDSGNENKIENSNGSIASDDDVTIPYSRANEFLSLSSIPPAKLKLIIAMSDHQKRNCLGKTEFFVAVRLIQLHQNGCKVTSLDLSVVDTDEDVELKPAFFEGVSGTMVPYPVTCPEPEAMTPLAGKGYVPEATSNEKSEEEHTELQEEKHMDAQQDDQEISAQPDTDSQFPSVHSQYDANWNSCAQLQRSASNASSLSCPSGTAGVSRDSPKVEKNVDAVPDVEEKTLEQPPSQPSNEINNDMASNTDTPVPLSVPHPKPLPELAKSVPSQDKENQSASNIEDIPKPKTHSVFSCVCCRRTEKVKRVYKKELDHVKRELANTMSNVDELWDEVSQLRHSLAESIAELGTRKGSNLQTHENLKMPQRSTNAQPENESKSVESGQFFGWGEGGRAPSPHDHVQGPIGSDVHFGNDSIAGSSLPPLNEDKVVDGASMMSSSSNSSYPSMGPKATESIHSAPDSRKNDQSRMAKVSNLRGILKGTKTQSEVYTPSNWTSRSVSGDSRRRSDPSLFEDDLGEFTNAHQMPPPQHNGMFRDQSPLPNDENHQLPPRRNSTMSSFYPPRVAPRGNLNDMRESVNPHIAPVRQHNGMFSNHQRRRSSDNSVEFVNLHQMPPQQHNGMYYNQSPSECSVEFVNPHQMPPQQQFAQDDFSSQSKSWDDQQSRSNSYEAPQQRPWYDPRNRGMHPPSRPTPNYSNRHMVMESYQRTAHMVMQSSQSVSSNQRMPNDSVPKTQKPRWSNGSNLFSLRNLRNSLSQNRSMRNYENNNNYPYRLIHPNGQAHPNGHIHPNVQIQGGEIVKRYHNIQEVEANYNKKRCNESWVGIV
mmetsp:Transcript_47986/g.71101  ORF Transcript_47986/g.71101 Transcript_47986/m.71101 type:complete len:885 (+) Transcript_47986:137-2791(+)|eukprot:CAMPEP_0195535134 /NCGR_PEP_ID=MMETSP0794_2-20130614/43697_1 /TAXON_ID=515487 /ORGANISM="Stephanopyxis turris, Strain CCMP 815" /LENGTH=884 /DNA_ID=CAMNT_0040668183 /DNA_START=74 /DNA_END=2728 /DNA_ORIENTATION=+